MKWVNAVSRFKAKSKDAKTCPRGYRVNAVSRFKAKATMKIPPKLRNRVMAPTSLTGSVLATTRWNIMLLTVCIKKKERETMEMLRIELIKCSLLSYF